MNPIKNIPAWISSSRKALGKLPRFVWLLLALAFIAGMFVRGSAPASPSSSEIQTEADTTTVRWWTCSMHPQIKLPKPGQCPICFMDLIPLEQDDSREAPGELAMSEAAVKLAEISTVPVVRGKGHKNLRLSGKVMVDETRLGRITAWAAGRLEKLYVNYTGSSVKKGDPLVRLYSPELYVAQEELLQAGLLLRGATTESLRESALLNRKAARGKLRELGLTPAQIDAVEKSGKASDRITITSPLSGVITRLEAREGLYLKQGSPICSIADLSVVWVELDVYESELAWIKKGQSVTFSVEALPGVLFKGRIFFIDPLLHSETRTVRALVEAGNREGHLKPGMFVRARVEAVINADTEGRPPLLVPTAAVLQTGKRALVYVRKEGTDKPVFQSREIVLGPRADDYYIVESGLQQGEEVVVKGNFKIDSAFQIAAKPSMMSPQGGPAGGGHHHEGTFPTGTMDTIPQEAESQDLMREDGFVAELSGVYQSYFQAQRALADDDFPAARTALRELDGIVTSLGDDGLQGKPLEQWQVLRDSLHQSLQHAPHWSDIADARLAFAAISRAVLRMERVYGHPGGKTHYEIFCPMAFNNKGAFWLQDQDTVKNSFFGAAMLSCGEIKNTYTPVEGDRSSEKDK